MVVTVGARLGGIRARGFNEKRADSITSRTTCQSLR